MLPWQQKKALAAQREHKQFIDIGYKVAATHICFLLLIFIVGSYKPALQLALGNTKKFRVDFCPVATYVENNREKKEPVLSTIEPAPKTPKVALFVPTTLLPRKTVQKKEEPAAVKITVKVPEKVLEKLEKTEIPEPIKDIKIVEKPKELPVKIAVKIPEKGIEKPKELPVVIEPIKEIIKESEEISLGTISQQETAGEETIGENSASHEIAAIITQQWHKVKGMPSDFSVNISFIINSFGKASSILILNGYKSLIYQAHAKESLSRCEFPKKYYNKKCRIILKM